MRVMGLALAAAFFVHPGVLYAAECNAETQTQIREIKAENSELSKTLRKAVARSEGQMLRQMELPEQAVTALPELPKKPKLKLSGFTDDGDPEITCAEDGTSVDAIAALKESLAAASDEVAVYETALVEHAIQLAAAEEAAAEGEESPAEVATTPQQSDESDANEGETHNDGAEAGPDDQKTENAEKPADVESAGTTRQPMPDPDNPNLFRRAISLPSAMLRTEASDDAEAEELPTFSVLYVFDESQANGQSWLEVGSSLRQDSSGWVKVEETLAWSSMLVMNFAPRGSRSEVLFFKNATTLTDLVSSAFYSTDASKIYERLRAQREAMLDDENHAPNWPSELVAVEPQTAVTFEGQPYLLPILDWREEAFDGADDTVLLKVAAVPADAGEIGQIDDSSFANSASVEAAKSDGVFRVGVTFVMDTTISMQPFIERTYETVDGFYDAFQQFETAQNVSFGLVGYRDNIDHAPDSLEYSVRVFSPLDVDADLRSVLATSRQMREATGPTIDFKEDGYLGIHTALTEMDWTPFDARLIVMVTDASSREGADPLAALSDTNAERLAELAEIHNVAILVIHLRTPANQSTGDFEIARNQYTQLTSTGDTYTEKYLNFDGTSDEEFAASLKKANSTIAEAVFKASAGSLVIDPNDLEPVPEKNTDKLASAIRTEIFRAQLESLATQDGGDAPTFLEGWAADKDLTDPSRKSLDVSVFLTRNQLSSMDKQLDSVVRAYRSGGDDPKAFFDNLQILAAEMSTDPDKPIPEGKDVVRTILPTFLANLPYRSQVLRLDKEYWLSLSPSNQQEFIESLEAKRQIYKDLDNNTSLWINFGANDPGLEATPVSLLNLP